MSRRLHSLGCWVLIGMGVAHGGGTLYDVFSPKFFTPLDPDVLQAMRATPVTIAARLGGNMSVWSGHLGWNLSHSLGIAFAGALPLLAARGTAPSRPLVLLALALAALWALLAAIFWFWAPLVGFVLAGACLAASLRERAPTAHAAPGSRSRLLVLGVLPMGLLGAVHGMATFPDAFVHGAFSPTEPGVRSAMEASMLALPAMFGSAVSTWTAYVGFNFSHGLAVTGFAVGAWLVARHRPDVGRSVKVLFALASCAWLGISIAFWFSVALWFVGPVLATAFAAGCHLAWLRRRA
jgi:hypothetical protein